MREAVYSFLRIQCCLAIRKVRDLENVAFYVLYSILCLVLDRGAAQNLGRPEKVVSPTYFNTQFWDKATRANKFIRHDKAH